MRDRRFIGAGVERLCRETKTRVIVVKGRQRALRGAESAVTPAGRDPVVDGRRWWVSVELTVNQSVAKSSTELKARALKRVNVDICRLDEGLLSLNELDARLPTALMAATRS
jgi:hypothetical protein